MVLAINGGQPVRTKPFTGWPIWGDKEIQYMTDVIKSGKWGPLHGDRVKEFEEKYAEYQNAKYGICCNSCTRALEIAVWTCGIEPGDHVILPAYTFIATATAVIMYGGIPVFCDIDIDTFNIKIDDIEKLITDKTRAIMPVHFAGRPVNMDEIKNIAEKHNLFVIEDAAQAWGSEWKGTKVGAIGDIGAFSFQSSKNLNCAEGGILITNDKKLAETARSYNNCGRMESGVWYEHYLPGGNSRMTEFQAAILLAQFEEYEKMKEKRLQNMDYLNKHLAEIDGITVLTDEPDITDRAVHLYIFRYNKNYFNGKLKSRFLEALNAEGIFASNGYSIPLYQQPIFRDKIFGPGGKRKDTGIDYKKVKLENTEKACFDEAVWLNQSTMLGEKEDMDDIINAITKIQRHADEL